MKKLLKNKRGMALETAIMFMLVAFTLGFLLTGVVMTSHLRVRLNAKTIENEIAIEQIGQNFVDGVLLFCPKWALTRNRCAALFPRFQADSARG